LDNVERYFGSVKITNPAYRAHRIAGRRIRSTAQCYFKGRMLEIGCGSKTKGLLVGDLVTEHVGLDHADTPHDKSNIDLFGTAYDIPVEGDSFDCVLSTAVLEHLEEPERALREAFRVLKPGGYALVTAPLFWHVHEEPRDFFRYTGFGLEYLFRKAGFQIAELAPLSGFGVTFLTELSYYLGRFRRGPLTPLIDISVAFNNLVSPLLDRGWMRDERFTWMHLVLARKPDVP
jgi:SAM-dependent methyltransferase